MLTAADDYVGDVFIEDERISLIGESLDVHADRTIDATGKYVLPGCVDPHTHLDMPFGGTVTIDDVESGQTSAAFGGTTCHVDFIIQPPGQTFAAALEERVVDEEVLRARLAVDVPALLAGERDRLDGLVARDVHHVEG